MNNLKTLEIFDDDSNTVEPSKEISEARSIQSKIKTKGKTSYDLFYIILSITGKQPHPEFFCRYF
jgi:hypothetical protein